MNPMLRAAVVTLLALFPAGYANASAPACQDGDFNWENLTNLLGAMDPAKAVPSDVSEIFERWTRASKCSDRAWDGQRFGDYPVVLFDSASSRHWMWKPGGGVVEIDDEQLAKLGVPKRGRPWGKFSAGGEEGFFLDVKNLVSGPVKDSPVGGPQGKFAFVAHEAFHVMQQQHQGCEHDDWTSPQPQAQGPMDRFVSALPSKCAFDDPATGPRLFRSELSRTLQLAIDATSEKKRKVALSEARSIYEAYRNKFPSDAAAASRTDQIEGTAEYAGTMTAFFSEDDKNCKSSENDLQRNFAKYSQSGQRRHGKPGDYFKASAEESYVLGQQAGQLLRKLDPNWTPQVRVSKTPLELLFPSGESSSIAAKTPSAPSKTILAQCQKVQTDTQKIVDEKAKPFVELWSSDDWVAVSIPNFQSASGPFQVAGPGFNGLVDDKTLLTEIEASYRSGTDWEVTVKGAPTLFGNDVCGNDRMIVLVPKSSITSGSCTDCAGDRLHGDTSVRFDPSIQPRSDGGKSTYCL